MTKHETMMDDLREAILALAEALDRDHQGAHWPDPIEWDGRPLPEQATDLLELAESQDEPPVPTDAWDDLQEAIEDLRAAMECQCGRVWVALTGAGEQCTGSRYDDDDLSTVETRVVPYEHQQTARDLNVPHGLEQTYYLHPDCASEFRGNEWVTLEVVAPEGEESAR